MKKLGKDWCLLVTDYSKTKREKAKYCEVASLVKMQRPGRWENTSNNSCQFTCIFRFLKICHKAIKQWASTLINDRGVTSHLRTNETSKSTSSPHQYGHLVPSQFFLTFYFKTKQWYRKPHKSNSLMSVYKAKHPYNYQPGQETSTMSATWQDSLHVLHPSRSFPKVTTACLL